MWKSRDKIEIACGWEIGGNEVKQCACGFFKGDENIIKLDCGNDHTVL